MTYSGSDLIDVACKTLIERENAIFFEVADDRVWVPKSQLEDWPNEGCEGEMIVREWIAIEKGLV